MSVGGVISSSLEQSARPRPEIPAWRGGRLWECKAMRLADLPDVQALSAREKLQLLDELWQDVAHDLESLEVSDTEKEVLDQRWAAFLRDPERRYPFIGMMVRELQAALYM